MLRCVDCWIFTDVSLTFRITQSTLIGLLDRLCEGTFGTRQGRGNSLAPVENWTTSLYSVRENSMPKLREVIGGTKTKMYCQESVCRRCVLGALRTVKLGLTKVGNQAKPLKYFEKKLYFVPIYSRWSNVCHWPRYTDDNDAAKTDACAQTCQVAAW